MTQRLIAYVGSYGAAPGATGGGIYGFEVKGDGRTLLPIGHAPKPVEAGYLVFAPDTATLYAVDERKTDGRGPVHPPASVHALAIEPNGDLRWLNAVLAPGPRPTFLDYGAGHRILVGANHGDFQHVEKVVRGSDGAWATQYVYDDSTVILYDCAPDGRISGLRDVQVLSGQGRDPNTSPQNGGHAQSSPHAHCAVIDPSGRFVLVGDKGTDRILVFRLGETLELVSVCQFEQETAPRHIAFDPATGVACATMELSSEIVSLSFNAANGELAVLDRASTLANNYSSPNEPAEIRIHPNGRFAYVNNRGEDSLAWFAIGDEGSLRRLGDVPLAGSIHPGLAARSFAFDPSGRMLLVADRPAHLLRAYAVDGGDGSLLAVGEAVVPDPACVAFVTLEGTSEGAA